MRRRRESERLISIVFFFLTFSFAKEAKLLTSSEDDTSHLTPWIFPDMEGYLFFKLERASSRGATSHMTQGMDCERNLSA